MSLWSSVFLRTKFVELLELDLRACSIQTLSGGIFKNMPKLKMLYLGENAITTIDVNAFVGLQNLLHLDISNNLIPLQDDSQNIARPSPLVFRYLKNLISLDLSFTRLNPRSSVIFRELGSKFERLSICETTISHLGDGVFNNTNLKYLDVSGNMGILNNEKGLQGVEDSLRVLYADFVGLTTLNFLDGFERLQVLKVANNDIAVVVPAVAATWSELKILDLTVNRIGSWWNATFSLIPNLSFLSLVQNNINLITEHMVKDVRKVDYIGLSRNFIVCNCHARELMDIAMRNEYNRIPRPLYSDLHLMANDTISFHTAFCDFDEIVSSRAVMTPLCRARNECSFTEEDYNGNFFLFDYDKEAYKCLAFEEATRVNFSTVEKCNHNTRDTNYDETILDQAMNYLFLLIIPAVLLPVLALGFFFRRWFVYFCITMRNSAMLSLINNGENIDAGKIFNYDVFVSYCNEDRAWVLDHLLPHLEKDCNVSVCLHERDFQVGLSILENIVSCMDRSKSIMLVISQKFLMSQWCQFEMHLAQHRLLETRREDLILVLLEKIPRHMRPNTLHYLMLTKTYIVWPNEKTERVIFWKRLNKSLLTQRIKQLENVSLA
ncbi:Toll-like receptor 6 [Eumeta japonica]|uniref:Toll-like receptor 6 n=1 Tax=Eumeta variegata TaxID=151549 RepID=A0A4C1X464_EUMVA|nr:Toll-like receptor 6 [Eumeta japonica]